MSGPWEDYAPAQDNSSGPWQEYQKKSADTATPSQYENRPISTFLANAVNSATFGLPDYLNRTFTPESYAQAQQYNQANPMAASAGEVAGYAVPTGAGAIRGAQLGSQAVRAVGQRFAPNLPELAQLYGRSQGAITGATLGAQTAAAVPGVVQGSPEKAVAAPEMINQFASQIPMINHLQGITGHVVPAIAAGAASLSRDIQERMRLLMQYQAAQKVLGQQ